MVKRLRDSLAGPTPQGTFLRDLDSVKKKASQTFKSETLVEIITNKKVLENLEIAKKTAGLCLLKSIPKYVGPQQF